MKIVESQNMKQLFGLLLFQVFANNIVNGEFMLSVLKFKVIKLSLSEIFVMKMKKENIDNCLEKALIKQIFFCLLQSCSLSCKQGKVMRAFNSKSSKFSFLQQIFLKKIWSKRKVFTSLHYFLYVSYEIRLTMSKSLLRFIEKFGHKMKSSKEIADREFCGSESWKF